MRLHDFRSRVEQSGSMCPAFEESVLKTLYPDFGSVVSVEKDREWQDKGVDYIVYDRNNEQLATLDKKERGTWSGRGSAPKVFDDVALEIVCVANTSLSPLDLKVRADFWKKEFVKTLRHTRNLKAVFKSLQARAEEGETVGPGWTTKNKKDRTVDATLYIIGPLGKGYLLDEIELQAMLVEELPRLVSKNAVVSMRGTLSRDDRSGRLWAVSNFGIPVPLLKEFMDVPEIAFEPYDINKLKNSKDTLLHEKKPGIEDRSTDVFLRGL